ncbi:MAG: protein phosphatase 2C domain-containing protein [Sandaracinaceae bacterium]|nr:protein phosphatase 2C domain-containing protein [Sandaracinaceae bacterium]
MSPLSLLRALVTGSPSSEPREPSRPRLVARAAGRSTVGRRSQNEDRLVVRADLGLFAVADGMGGYEGGEIASQAAVDALVELYASHQADGDVTWPHVPDGELSLAGKRAIVAVELAHRAVRARRKGELAQMGTTVVLFTLEGSHLVVAHAGDSRAFLVRDGVLHRLTRDDSFLAELEARGGTTHEELSRMAAQFGHVVTKALGHGERVTPTVRELEVRAGDVLMLSSDGLHGVLDEEELAHTLSMFAPEDATEILLARAIEEGSTDNVTCVAVRVEIG